jgi:hypothetical protein
MLLDSHVAAFQEFNQGEHVSGLVEMDFCLRPKRTPSKALWCRSIRHQTAASANTREAAVIAITTSMNGVLDELIAELNRQFEAISAPQPYAEENNAPRKPFSIPRLR